ncbi:hypothetical protein CHLNCDRAFT_141170 [Chlorella variabilis]|uniref:F-box domain-containing protein n=1 Tax=Chlorella variabilis TaxID=554065 RepID=E1ZS86_CHLVA|nr:hypothetical protein CHLNCDRAFT_141170 [Chlorella variabilis]EFN51261.1 hypothetical protein CHLNCDRAFT_141170 [Chlorella variabilis]|eukprot:XP_005843363.1 hypothetical protein CHLNCDRAFT_141170 [Chlorella variabilis]
MAHSSDHQAAPPEPGKAGGACRKRKAAQVTVLPPFVLHAQLQSRQLMSRWKLRPAEGSNGLLSGRAAATAPAAAASDRPAAKLGGKPAGRKGVPHTYVPVRTLPLIFAQRRQHLQQQKAKAQHRGPYEQRDGEGLLALPEDVLLKVVCFLTHDELKPLFQVCKALRTTLRNAVAYHFNYNTPSRPVEEHVPPVLGERQRRPARTNVQQVMSRLARGVRGVSGRSSGTTASSRSTAPRALDFADLPASGSGVPAAVPVALGFGAGP